jgi:hypothetical protein
MLFGQLHPDAFTLFSGSNRFLYERVLVGIYEGFFRSDLHFPGENDVVGRIYEELANHPDLWREDESAVVLDELSTRRGRRIRRKGHEAADSQATGGDGPCAPYLQPAQRDRLAGGKPLRAEGHRRYAVGRDAAGGVPVRPA